MSHHHRLGENAFVNVNGDWSGDAEICWRNRQGNDCKASVPGELLLRLAKIVAADEVTGKINDLLDEWAHGEE